jgi:hypothetical protein
MERFVCGRGKTVAVCTRVSKKAANPERPLTGERATVLPKLVTGDAVLGRQEKTDVLSRSKHDNALCRKLKV